MTEINNKPTKSQSLPEHKTTFVDDDKNTKLHYLVTQGNIEVVREEIHNGHKIDMANYLGWTPLMMAARYGHTDIVKILLENFADSTKRNKFGYSVFHVAVASGNLELVTFLLQHLLKGGVTKKTMEGILSPISLCVLFNHLHLAKYFIVEQSFNINSETLKTGLTPLAFSAAMGNSNFYNYLLSNGAEVDFNSTSGIKISEIIREKQSQHQQNHEVTPLIIVHPSVSPHQQFVAIPSRNLYPNVFKFRKYSSQSSPCILTPAISPITPTFSPASPLNYSYITTYQAQQIFFPPDFTTNNFPNNSYNNNLSPSNNFLNVRMNNSPSFLCFSPQFSPQY